jgi:glycosyltransferase involved in cell wall biosynthesis
MKILYFIPRYDTTAMGNRIHAEVIDAWRQHDVTAEVVTLTAGLRQRVSEEQEGILIHRLPVSSGMPLKLANRTLGLALHYPYLAGALAHYRQFLQTRQYDLVHVETAFPLGVVAALMPRKLHPPLAVTLPGADIMAEPEYDYGYGRFRTVRALLPHIFKRAVVLRADSPQIRDLAIRRGAAPDKVVAIPYNITADSYPPDDTPLVQLRARCRAEVVARHHLDTTRPIVVSLSRLHPFKGVAYLVEALPQVRQAAVLPQVLIIGPSRHTPRFGDYGAYLQRRAGDLGISDSVQLVGAVDHALTMTYLAAADVVVVPSVAESFNRVAVEAAAVGTPTVVTRTTGVSVYVQEQQVGLVIEPRSAAAIAEALIRLLTGQELWDTCHWHAPQMAAAFSSTAIAADLLRLYEPFAVPGGAGVISLNS